jgi:prophage antirepressor-like protein
MSAITPFNFDSKTIRVVTDENGEPLFVGKDVCDALGYANASDAIKQHCKGVAKRYPLQTAGGG